MHMPVSNDTSHANGQIEHPSGHDDDLRTSCSTPVSATHPDYICYQAGSAPSHVGPKRALYNCVMGYLTAHGLFLVYYAPLLFMPLLYSLYASAMLCNPKESVDESATRSIPLRQLTDTTLVGRINGALPEKRRAAWEKFIGTLGGDWVLLNFISAFLFAGDLTLLQTYSDTDIRVLLILSILFTGSSAIYATILIICFSRLKDASYVQIDSWVRISPTAEPALIWVSLALPLAWTLWGVITLTAAMAVFDFTSRGTNTSSLQWSTAERASVATTFAINLIYLGLFLGTLRRYGRFARQGNSGVL